MPLLLTLAACFDPPWTNTSGQVAEDGIHVKVMLEHIDEVRIAGVPAKDGDEILLPLSLARPGLNSIPLEGEGLDPKKDVLHFNASATQVLRPACSGGEGNVRGEALVGFAATGCTVVDGFMQIPITVPDGATITLDNGAIKDGVLYIDLLPPVLAREADSGVSMVDSRSERTLTVTYADGAPYTETLSVSYRGDVLGDWINAAPASLDRMGKTAPDKPKVAVFPSGGSWWLEGQAQTWGDIDLVVKVVDRAEPRQGERCAYNGLFGQAGFALQAIEQDQTLAAYTLDGKELARQSFQAKGCPDSATIQKGQTEMTVVPGYGAIQAWVKGLLGSSS